jgi:alkane 1-monooxygenase
MFLGNWLLAFSWDCAFALEHVYGHHKNVCLPNDPATAKRGQNIYTFIIPAIITEQKDAWKIEFDHLKRRGNNPYGIHNKMVIGYLRSLSITISAYFIGGVVGMLFYLLCAFIAKSLLEVINYTEHYGLVREPNQPVCIRHSWNSNNIMSSLLLFNVTRHSAHHEKPNLKFWELDAYSDAPMMPQGYLSMLYLALFLPFVYHEIMAKKLMDWDENYATPTERKIAMAQD